MQIVRRKKRCSENVLVTEKKNKSEGCNWKNVTEVRSTHMTMTREERENVPVGEEGGVLVLQASPLGL